MNKFIEELNIESYGQDEKSMVHKTSVTIQDLVGVHTFTGFNTSSDNDSNTAIFVLDDITYMAIEDPDDGYRSSMNKIIITNEKCTNKIPVHFVNGEIDDEVINFIDIVTKETVLSIGTDYSDSYYPSFVDYFNPTNLAINKDAKGYQKTLREYKLKRILK
jgi:hypothetical protein